MCGGADVQERRQHSGVKEHLEKLRSTQPQPLRGTARPVGLTGRVALPAEVSSQSTDEHFPASLDKQEWESEVAH